MSFKGNHYYSQLKPIITMGAGCSYKHQTIPEAEVVWVELPIYENKEGDEFPFSEEELYDIAWMDTLDNLVPIIESLGYERYNKLIWTNKLHWLKLESTYYGDGILIYLESQYDNSYHHEDVRLHNLAKANHKKAYAKLVNTIIKSGMFEVRAATSAWTSCKLDKY